LLVLDALRDLALIQVPWPADRWQIRPDAEVTPIEDLQWAFACLPVLPICKHDVSG
jgi:hypothetical protein